MCLIVTSFKVKIKNNRQYPTADRIIKEDVTSNLDTFHRAMTHLETCKTINLTVKIQNNKLLRL